MLPPHLVTIVMEEDEEGNEKEDEEENENEKEDEKEVEEKEEEELKRPAVNERLMADSVFLLLLRSPLSWVASSSSSCLLSPSSSLVS